MIPCVCVHVCVRVRRYVCACMRECDNRMWGTYTVEVDLALHTCPNNCFKLNHTIHEFSYSLLKVMG